MEDRTETHEAVLRGKGVEGRSGEEALIASRGVRFFIFRSLLCGVRVGGVRE